MAISLIDKIKPKNGGSFAMVDAEDVDCGSVRLDTALSQRPPVQVVEEMPEQPQDGVLYIVLESET